jgi:hypothetical protein
MQLLISLKGGTGSVDALTLLPISLKVIHITARNSFVVVSLGDEVSMANFRSLVSLEVCRIRIPLYSDAFQLMSYLSRLRKLCNIFLGTIEVQTMQLEDTENLETKMALSHVLGFHSNGKIGEFGLSLKLGWTNIEDLCSYPTTHKKIWKELSNRSGNTVTMESLELDELCMH